MSDWTILDDNSLLCCRPVPPKAPDSYEFLQLNSYGGHADGVPFYQIAHGTIHIHHDYTESDVERVLTAFGYRDLQALAEQSKYDVMPQKERAHDVHQRLAELFFRYEQQEYVDREFRSRNDAISHIASVTGLDLRPYLDQKLLLVTAHERGEDVNFLTTQEEFFGTDAAFAESLPFQKDSGSASPGFYRIPKSISRPAYDVRYLSLSVPDTAAAQLSDFLTGYWNNPASLWRNAPERTSSHAKQLLSQLLTPVLDEACTPKDWQRPVRALQWAHQHPGYFKSLDTIFSSLDLLKVQRIRISVTQGEAAVFCCDKKIVQYGDDQWLQHENGKISNGYLEREGRLHGEIISGWGSSKSDESFRRAALVQFADRIRDTLLPVKTLEQTIQDAKRIKPAPVPVFRQPDTPER